MKKFLLSFFVFGLFLAYSLNQKNKEKATNVVFPSPADSASSQSNSAAQGGGNPSPVQNSQANSVAYKNGVHEGDVEDAFYGNVQVQATIEHGKITNVTFLQYPNSNYTCIAINSQAMPYLKQEALQSQSANVDIVSGATDTSQAFIESLQSALEKAKT